MIYAPAILLGRAVRVLARWRKPGGGSAVPGLVVNRVAPGFLPQVLNSFPQGLVVVSGSSGKSTTTKMLVGVLRAHGLSVFTNASTANIAQGLTSALLEESGLNGKIARDIAVLEMDEGHGAALARSLTPRVVALTNVMVDQIDRFHDSDMVAALLRTIAARATGVVVVNADDAYLMEIAAATTESGVAVGRYGVSDSVLESNVRGLGYTRTSSHRLSAADGIVVTGVQGRTATISIDGNDHSVALPARGTHYAVDAATALSTARAALGDRFDADRAVAAIGEIPAVFGRGEIVTVRGQTVEFVLVQNPASFQLNVDSLEPDTEQILMIIGSDVRDTSYFWPV
ncbi:MAG: Mur ligase family protein, partial [Cryobacterium sp.]